MVSPVLVALDLPTAGEARRMAAEVASHVGGFKVGLGLLHRRGSRALEDIVAIGKPVFADAKLHDIPSQVEAAAHQLGARGARWVTAHIGGGAVMLAAAQRGLARGSGGTGGILGVSVLTSLDTDELEEVGIAASPAELVPAMATVAVTARCEGIVCSPRELAPVGAAAPALTKVVPGIRPPGSPADDQRRTATPRQAIDDGADWLVIGRPITGAKDPAKAAKEIFHSIQSDRSS